MRTSHWALLIGALAVGGCNGGGDRAERDADSAGMMGHMDSGSMEMGGMNMRGMLMMAGMRAHMDSMMRMSPQQMQAMMTAHQERMSRMMDGMGADMRSMRMSGSPHWNALTDSVKRDLAELSNLAGQALSARMRAHRERVSRLMAMHEKMMGSAGDATRPE
jgi:hypothetical protein